MSLFDSLSTNEGQAAFWGAFFAAFFSLLVYALTRFLSSVGERRKRHYDYLVKLESKLNEHLNRSYQNIYVIRGVLKTTKEGKISYNNIDALGLRPIGEYHDLLDIEIINKVFRYDRNLDALNADLAGIGKAYSEMRSALFGGTLDYESFMKRYPTLPKDLQVIINSWNNHTDEIINLLTQVRLAIPRDKSWYISAIHWLMSRKIQPPTITEFDAEKTKLMQEVEHTRKVSREKLDEIYKDKDES